VTEATEGERSKLGRGGRAGPRSPPSVRLPPAVQEHRDHC
jgi:hypothetical protein